LKLPAIVFVYTIWQLVQHQKCLANNSTVQQAIEKRAKHFKIII